MTDTSITEKIEEYVQSRMRGIKWEYEQLRDLVAGKQTFKQYIQNYAEAYKKFFMQSEAIRSFVEQAGAAREVMAKEYERAKQDFWKNMEKNYPDIRKDYRRHLKDNEMNHRYDMSAAVRVDGVGYVGVREKPSFWKRVKNILSGKKSPYAAVRDNSKVVRKVDALIKATLDTTARKEKIEALRGRIDALRASGGAQKPEQTQVRSNVYEAVKSYCIIGAMSANGISGVSVNGMDINQCTEIIRNTSPKDLQEAISTFKADSQKPSNMTPDMKNNILAGVDNLEQIYLPQRSKSNYVFQNSQER